MLKTQIVDVSRSAIITDPEAFYENLMATGAEDSPEKMMPIIAYEGYNFLPTVYGYRSYFDATSHVTIQALPGKCDKIINFQFADYSNLLIAFTEDGIYTNPGKVSGAAWVLQVAKTRPPSGQYKEWTYTVIENVLYMYLQGDSLVYKLNTTGSYTPISFTPSFLNMTGQMGIFRANGRLGFWDSANSISWSSVFDHTDFTPSIETLAGNVIFNDVLGRIVSIKSSGSGFVIYSTKNIVGAAYSTGGSILFDAHTIAEAAGIWSSKQVCTGVMDTEHYAYTNTGIKHITNAEKVETVFTPIYDFLREARDPVYLDYLQGRYLFINVINPAYIDGYVTFTVQNVGALVVRLLYNGGEYTPTPPTDIQGVPFQDALRDKLDAGFTEGQYAQWGASGSKLIPSRSPSPMDPYQIDDPFTPADDYPYAGNTAVLYDTTELINARDNSVWTNKVSVNNAVPFALDLGWHDIPLGTGLTDSELTRMKARQIHEWNEYYSLVNDTITAIGSLPVNSIVNYDATIYSPGTAPTYPTVDSGWVDIGVLPNPSSGVLTETFTGVGTYSPSYELKTAYSTEFPIQRKTRTEHNGVHLAKVGVMYQTGQYGVALSGYAGTAWAAALPTYAAYSPAYTTSIPTIKSTDDATTRLATWNAIIAALGTLLPLRTTFTYNSQTKPADSTVIDANWFDNSNLTGTYQVTVSATNNWGFGTETLSTTYYVVLETAETRSQLDRKWLQAGLARAGSAFNSILAANQEILDWATYTTTSPPAGFNWNTNSQSLTATIDFAFPPPLELPSLAGITFPGAGFLLQDAIPAAIFPDFAGSLVYDTFLQKWGKMKASFRALMDYSPVNSANNGSISYSNFGLDAGTLHSGGYVYLFTSKCTDSKLRYGKFGFSRQGFSVVEQIDIHFRKPFTGDIQLDVSLDGRSVHQNLTQTASFVGMGSVSINPESSGKWFVIMIKGEFDIRSIEFTGRPAGIR
jgi:hypothetical protein